MTRDARIFSKCSPRIEVLAESYKNVSIFIVICLLIVARNVSLSFLLVNIFFIVFLSSFSFYINIRIKVSDILTYKLIDVSEIIAKIIFTDQCSG